MKRTWVHPDLLTASVVEFLKMPTHNDWLARLMHSPTPLKREFDYDARVWERWLGVTPPSSFIDRRRLDSVLSTMGKEVLASGRSSYGRIGRQELKEVADEVVVTNSGSPDRRRACIRLWVATRIWGAGRIGGRTQWNTRRSLLDGTLLAELNQSVDAFLAGNAFHIPKVSGADLSYTSKWLWALSMTTNCDETDTPRAYILDNQVRLTLGWLAAYQANISPSKHLPTPTGRAAYQEYCTLLESVAAAIRRGSATSAIDGEKIEWILFSAADSEYRSFRSLLPLVTP